MELKDLFYIIQAHDKNTKDPSNRVRKWDGKAPYYNHPIWCASMIEHETSLPEEIRINGSQALLYHDVLEDTTVKLPSWLSQEVVSLVQEMTFESSEDEWENLWQRSQEARLLKIYDKTSNMMDGVWMQPERREKHIEHLRKLYEDVRKNYGDLNITKLAATFI